jgi:hypothetical protein
MPRAIPAFAILAVLCSASVLPPANSQKVETGSGVRTGTVQTDNGTLHVNLPEEVVAGDTLTGTVIEEPAGRNDAERKENSGQLEGYVVDYDGQRRTAKEGTIPWQVRPDLAGRGAEFKIYDGAGHLIASWVVPVLAAPRLPSPARIESPRIGQAGRPLAIRGPFDGTLQNVSVTIGPQEVRPLVVSPRMLVVSCPVDPIGLTQIKVTTPGGSASGPLNIVGLKLSAPGTTITRGEHVTVTATVTGLEGLPESQYPLPFQTVNYTPSVIRFASQPGTIISQAIPYIAVQDGRWTTTFPITGISAGSFNLTSMVYYDMVHDAKKDMDTGTFQAWINGLIGAWQNEIKKIDSEENSAKASGKKWPDSPKAKGREMRRNVLQTKITELTAASEAADGGLDVAKSIADKALADVTVVEMGADMAVFAADLLGYKDLPLPALTSLLKGLKAIAKGEKVIKLIEDAEKIAEAYEKTKDMAEKAKKLEELKQKVDEVKKAMDQP